MCDITICALCNKQLCAANLLPCLDSFCLKCLEELAPGAEPGDELTCPTCEATFRIPDKGLSALPANSFVDNLIKIRRRKHDEKDLGCEVCATEDEDEKAIPATSYCLDCCQNMCEQCSSYHVKFSSTKEHRVLSREEEESSPVIRVEDTDWCDRHGNRRQELYCRECESSICVKCYTEKHNSHTCSDVGTVAEEFREQMQKNVEEMEQLTIESRSEERDLCRARDNILDQVTETEFSVLKWREELISCVERDTNELMNELQCFRDFVSSEFDVSCNKIRKRSEEIDKFKQFTREVIGEGSASVVASIRGALNQRASEIQAQHQMCHVRKHATIEVAFQPTGLSSLSRAKNKRKINLVGRVTGTVIPPEYRQFRLWKMQSSCLPTTPKYPVPVFRFGSAQPESNDLHIGTGQIHIPRIKHPKHFSTRKGLKIKSTFRIDDVIRQRGHSNEASKLSTSSDEGSIQYSDEDAIPEPAAEAVKEDAATAQKSSMESVEDDNSSAANVIFSHEAKLYRFSNGAWCLHGVGSMQVVRMQEKNVVYLLMKNKEVCYMRLITTKLVKTKQLHLHAICQQIIFSVLSVW